MKNSNSLAIRLSHVSKEYVIHHEKPTLVENLANGQNEKFLALRNINLEIKKGERVGVVGPNGSGKTTLVKIMAGITTPTAGHVETQGKVVSLIDLEAGFHPDLTGEQNIYLNGALLGIRRKELSNHLRQIADFAGLTKFIDAPLYSYSAGMKLRLAFAIALQSRCEILLMDEIMTFGDLNFQKRAMATIKYIQKKRSITTVVTSHVPLFVIGFATIFYELNKGRLVQKPRAAMLKTIKAQEEKWKKVFFRPQARVLKYA